MHPKYEQANELTKEVIDAACEVREHFNIGLLESIYQKCQDPGLHELFLKTPTNSMPISNATIIGRDVDMP